MNFNMFDEIDYFTNVNTENDMNMDTNINKNSNLFNTYEGYVKGNLFKNLYKSYKNLKPVKIPVNSERDELLLNIGQLSFAKHELNLLLDNYPNNTNALNLFNKYQKMETEQVKNYERRFGPLTVSSNMENIPFAWVNDIWPWEN